MSGGHRPGCRCQWCGVHGEARRTVEYLTWQNMRARCNNPNNPRYKDYGGRGIGICARWDDYANFLADMGRRPGRGYSLDRVDNDGDYEPSNCRWATTGEQAANRRHQPSTKVTDAGREFIRQNVGRMSKAAIAAVLGVSPQTVSRVLLREAR